MDFFILRGVKRHLSRLHVSPKFLRLWRKGLPSGQSLQKQDLLVDAEPVQHHHQVLSTAGHLALHGQAEVLLHALGDAPSDRVVPEGSNRETEGHRAERWFYRAGPLG